MIVSSAEGGSIWPVIAGALSVPLLVALNALFVAAQFALVALRQTRVEEMTRQKLPGSTAVASAMDNLDRCVAAAQLGMVLIGLLLGWLGEPAIAELVRPLVDSLSIGWHEAAFRSLTTVLTMFLITFITVVFGELIPKTVGLQNSEWTALWVSRPLLWFTRLAHPLVVLMDGTGNRILRWIGYDPDAEAEQAHSVQELILVIEDSAEAGVLTPNQATFVTNLLKLSEKRARDILVPAERMGVIEYGTEPETILNRIRAGTYTRMPVYQGSIDNILGVANTKQLLRNYTLTDVLALSDVIYPALFVAPDDPLPKVMRTLREARFPMALVRHENGEVLGLLTLEDVLEEVVGDIVDEHDYPVPKVTPRMLQALVKSLPKRKAGPAPLPEVAG